MFDSMLSFETHTPKSLSSHFYHLTYFLQTQTQTYMTSSSNPLILATTSSLIWNMTTDFNKLCNEASLHWLQLRFKTVFIIESSYLFMLRYSSDFTCQSEFTRREKNYSACEDSCVMSPVTLQELFQVWHQTSDITQVYWLGLGDRNPVITNRECGVWNMWVLYQSRRLKQKMLLL